MLSDSLATGMSKSQIFMENYAQNRDFRLEPDRIQEPKKRVSDRNVPVFEIIRIHLSSTTLTLSVCRKGRCKEVSKRARAGRRAAEELAG